jgi:hypothetical protein
VDCHLSLTAVELYQEKLRDLMCPASAGGPGGTHASLQVVEDKRRGVWMRGATELNVREGVDVEALLAAAQARRATGACISASDTPSAVFFLWVVVTPAVFSPLIAGSTTLNSDSSRSHLIIILCLETAAHVSKLYLVVGPQVDSTPCRVVHRSTRLQRPTLVYCVVTSSYNATTGARWRASCI